MLCRVRQCSSPVLLSHFTALPNPVRYSSSAVALASPRVDVSSRGSRPTIKELRRAVVVAAPGRMSGLQPYLRVGIRNMAGQAPLDLEAFGKAATGSGSPSDQRGDCPFSQRIYIDLEEKNLPYKATYIEEGDNKPDWFTAKNPAGLMPVLRDGETWIQDSDKIQAYLEEKFPEPSLKTPPQYKNVGVEVFPAFTSWLQTKNPDDQSKEKFVSELKALDAHLKAHGPYIGGEKPTDSDYALIPKLRHSKAALKYYLNFDYPAELTSVHKYIELLTSRPSFKKTDSPEDMIVQGWGKKFGISGPIVQPQTA